MGSVPAEETEDRLSRGRRARPWPGRAVAAVLDPTPAAMRAIALAGVICTAGIIATGAARANGPAPGDPVPPNPG